MWTLIKRKLLFFVMTTIMNFLKKRGLRVATHHWPDLMVTHLETVDGVKELLMVAPQLANFRVKQPKEYVRLVNMLSVMQEEARAVTLALNPPASIHQEEGELEE